MADTRIYENEETGEHWIDSPPRSTYTVLRGDTRRMATTRDTVADLLDAERAADRWANSVKSRWAIVRDWNGDTIYRAGSTNVAVLSEPR